MDLQTQLKALADKIERLKDHIETEESTKHAFVLPFINLLGYDSFNPTEVVPEFTADVGLKKGEKVDYAIFHDEEPVMIIECKNWKEDLDIHNAQLSRYFHVTETSFAVLTNGIKYRFYTDLDESNIMDVKPFLEFDITTLKDNSIQEIAKFHKSNFDVHKIFDNASNLKYLKEIKKLISEELYEPTYNFVRLFASQVYTGRLTERVMDDFNDIVHKAFNQTINETINDRLSAALNKEAEKQQEDDVETHEEISKIITTDEELEGYRIVVAILCRRIPKDRIVHRDTQSYFGVLLDDNNRKPICRLHLDGIKKYISLFDQNKKVTKEQIISVDDIYHFEKQLLDIIDHYERMNTVIEN